MSDAHVSRRELMVGTAQGAVAASAAGCLTHVIAAPALAVPETSPSQGRQRLSLDQLRQWESLGFGMFIHFGMSTFVGNELPDGKDPPATYAPDRLDVDQWISVARDAGMKYAVLCAKHVAGHCLWPSKHTTYSVAHSADRTDVCEKLVTACQKRGVLPGFYYCSWDNHHRFGSRTPSDPGAKWGWRHDFAAMESAAQKDANAPLPAYTTSVYQSFQTAQITELLTQYGPIAEVWIDIPGVLERGYRTFLYETVARLQPKAVIMMNSGISTGEEYDVDYAWPSDLIAIERRLPPESGHVKWRTIAGQSCYMPGEVCDPIGKNWFFVPGDVPRPEDDLLSQYQACRQRGVNFLLDVPPDQHGLIPDFHVQALARLGKKIGA